MAVKLGRRVYRTVLSCVRLYHRLVPDAQTGIFNSLASQWSDNPTACHYAQHDLTFFFALSIHLRQCSTPKGVLYTEGEIPVEVTPLSRAASSA